MDIAIIGAGVGGLTLALSLHHRGFKNITIYESASEVSELGVGVNILPHATKILEKLDVLPELVQGSVVTSELNYYSRLGQLIWNEPRGIQAGYHTPQLSIHRGVLINVLHAAVKERLGETAIQTGMRFEYFQHTDKGTVIAKFQEQCIEVDMLIGCDGIHSAVRHNFYPNEDAPIWSGITMWRGVTYMKPILESDSMIIAGHSEHRMVVYPISKPDPVTGKVLMNWVAKHKTDKAQPMPKQDWVHQTSKEDIPEAFLKFTFLRVDEMFNNAEAIFKYPMVDRDPLPSWHFNKVTLLGDAAHPMYPSGSNGASQAIIDSEVLADLLLTSHSISEAIELYDHTRRNATAQIVYANRQAGPERCIDIVEDLAPDGFDDIESIISIAQLAKITNSYKKVAGFVPEKLEKEGA